MSKAWGWGLGGLVAGIFFAGCVGSGDAIYWDSGLGDETPDPEWAAAPGWDGEIQGDLDEADEGAVDDASPQDLDRDGFSPAEGDCDDADPQVNPAALERCGDRIDNDCDLFIDEPSAVDARRFYLDEDGDGYGDPARYLTMCAGIKGFVEDAGDCDDGDDRVHPSAPERCGDGLDSDCDGDDDTAADGDCR